MEDFIEDALAQVEASDLPEQEYAALVNAQARFMAGSLAETEDPYIDIAIQAHLRS